MATEKLSTINGVDVSINSSDIVLFELNIESPIISHQIEIPISEWDEIKKFIDEKLKEKSNG